MKLQLWTAGMYYYIGTFERPDAPSLLILNDRYFFRGSVNPATYSEVESNGTVDSDDLKFEPSMSCYLPPADPRFKSSK